MIGAYGVFHGSYICFDDNAFAIYEDKHFADMTKVEYSTLFPDEEYTVKPVNVEVRK